jgi:hypothetical protein
MKSQQHAHGEIFYYFYAFWERKCLISCIGVHSSTLFIIYMLVNYWPALAYWRSEMYPFIKSYLPGSSSQLRNLLQIESLLNRRCHGVSIVRTYNIHILLKGSIVADFEGSREKTSEYRSKVVHN